MIISQNKTILTLGEKCTEGLLETYYLSLFYFSRRSCHHHHLLLRLQLLYLTTFLSLLCYNLFSSSSSLSSSTSTNTYSFYYTSSNCFQCLSSPRPPFHHLHSCTFLVSILLLLLQLFSTPQPPLFTPHFYTLKPFLTYVLPDNCELPELSNGKYNSGYKKGLTIIHGASIPYTCDEGYLMSAHDVSCYLGLLRPAPPACIRPVQILPKLVEQVVSPHPLPAPAPIKKDDPTPGVYVYDFICLSICVFCVVFCLWYFFLCLFPSSLFLSFSFVCSCPSSLSFPQYLNSYQLFIHLSHLCITLFF